jgi:hypothetical protein
LPRPGADARLSLALAIFSIDALRFGGAIAPGGSSEDVRIDREHGLAYLSLLDRDRKKVLICKPKT